MIHTCVRLDEEGVKTALRAFETSRNHVIVGEIQLTMDPESRGYGLGEREVPTLRVEYEVQPQTEE